MKCGAGCAFDEVTAAVREAVGPHFPVAFRFSHRKGGHYDATIAEDPAELAAFLAPLADAGVSMFHVSARRYWLPAFDGDRRTLAGWTRHLTGLPVITEGSVGVAAPVPGAAAADESPAAPQTSLTLAPLVDLLTRGEFDLVALGRAVLADPYWGAKVADGRLRRSVCTTSRPTPACSDARPAHLRAPRAMARYLRLASSRCSRGMPAGSASSANNWASSTSRLSSTSAVDAADERGLVVHLGPVLEAAAQLEQPPDPHGQPGLLADLADDRLRKRLAALREAAGKPH